VREIHLDYIQAGTDVITTNTFRTTAHTFSKADKPEIASHLTERAVAIARQAVSESRRPVLIAGSIAPLEDCFSPDLVPATDIIELQYKMQVDQLIDAGVDFILAETMINRAEIEFLSDYLHKLSFPYAMSFTIDGNALLDGTALSSVISYLESRQPIALLLNCRDATTIRSGLGILQSQFKGITGAYGNGPGQPDDTLGWSPAEGAVEDYLRTAKQWLENGARIIGGCCGTTPEHITALNAYRNTLKVSP
jgi:homocysteine S-methyltransferase